MESTRTLFFLLLCLSLAHSQLPGTWEVIVEDAGIASMHTAVTSSGAVLLLDRTHIGPSLLPLPHCHSGDCTAHSALLDPTARTLRPLHILTDTWCSSGQFLPDGTLLHTGGDLDGNRKLRLFPLCNLSSSCDWLELPAPLLSSGRWYATDQILPNGSVIVIGGRASPSVEFYPSSPGGATIRPFPFLRSAADPQMDNLYPFVHLLPSGHLFVFANSDSVLYDPASGEVLRRYPALPGGPRNYPSGGSSVMLPLDSSPDGAYPEAEIVVCGGAQYGAFLRRNPAAPADATCGRIVPTAEDATWEVEEMPFPRAMGDMVVLPTGDVLIVNGAMAGAQGFEMGSLPCLHPLLYRPSQPSGLRFMTLTPTAVPRLYHSTANLLPDGRVLIAGSNPHYYYRFQGTPFPTELRIEAFSPEYLSADRAVLRPSVAAAPEEIRYGESFEVEVTVALPAVGVMEVNLASAPFATHSFSQGQRLVKLLVATPEPAEDDASEGAGRHRYRIKCTAPPRGAVAPPGYYMTFIVNQGVPSVAKWIRIVI